MFIDFREKVEGRKRNIDMKEKHQVKHQLADSHMYPDQGLNPQPRYVP